MPLVEEAAMLEVLGNICGAALIDFECRGVLPTLVEFDTLSGVVLVPQGDTTFRQLRAMRGVLHVHHFIYIKVWLFNLSGFWGFGV